MVSMPPVVGTVYTNPRGRKYTVVRVDGDAATVKTTCARFVAVGTPIGRVQKCRFEEYERTDTLRWRIAVPENGWARQDPGD